MSLKQTLEVGGVWKKSLLWGGPGAATRLQFVAIVLNFKDFMTSIYNMLSPFILHDT